MVPAFDTSAAHRRAGPAPLRVVAAAALAAAAAGCYVPPQLPASTEGHISRETTRAEPVDIPQPARAAPLVALPRPAVKPATFTVVVNEVPVKELLFALARDSKQNIDISPALAGTVSLNAINETLPAILDRISKQVDMRYRIEGNTISVVPDTPYFRVYRVNYINMTRDSSSTIGASGQIAQSTQAGGTAQGGGGAPATGGTGGQTNSSTTLVRTQSNNNFWDTVRDNIRSILASTRAQTLSAEDKAARAEAVRNAREERLQQAEAVARAGSGAQQLYNTAFGSAPQLQLPGDARDNIVINSLAGTVNVFATEKQHALVQQYLDGISASVQRQVLIEATIAEVDLGREFQLGVDWSRIATGPGWSFTQSLLGAGNFTAGSITVGYTSANITSSIQALSQFGNTRVLSSPKIMAINNQTALLKVVENLVYFNVQAQQGIVTTGGAVQPPVYNTYPQTVPVGVVMSVTPQINDNGRVTLTVRPTITRAVDFIQDPNPSLVITSAGGLITKTIKNEVPQIQTREMESVLQVGTGQTVVIGGLIQDEVSRERNYVPFLGNIPGLGELFSYRDDKLRKTELVIFLRPTVIVNPSLDSDELARFRRYLPDPAVDPTITEQPRFGQP
jgi:general secretion pathway protein D